MAGLVDIHSHVLPEVDDGATSMEMALEMLRRGLAEGIETAVLTPHLKPGDGADKEALHQARFAAFKEAVEREVMPGQLHSWADLTSRFGLADIARAPSGTLAGSGVDALVELAGRRFPPFL